jgi:Bacterial tandem repeat domain 1
VKEALPLIKAHMPIYYPYRKADVALGNGIWYKQGDFHKAYPEPGGCLDYNRTAIGSGEDPTFGVHSVADGKVIEVAWGVQWGNSIRIEHTAPDGYKYQSTYVHLRNGKTHDINLARHVEEAGNKWISPYKLFAMNYPNAVSWGTESHKIMVKVGDNVYAGQQIAWAGNTGTHGAGAILDVNGNPRNRTSYNVHLHFFLHAQDPRPGKSNNLIAVDPYGVYNTLSVGCYDVGSTTPYKRLFAPFYPDFSNIPVNILSKYWDYYADMGMSLQTLSVDNNQACGSFQWGLSPNWHAWWNLTPTDFQTKFDYYWGLGFRPRQINVGDNGTRFTVIWEKNTSGEGTIVYLDRDEATEN